MNEELRKAFTIFKNRYARAWQLDTEDDWLNKNRSSTLKAFQAAEQAELELLELMGKLR